MPVHYLLQHIDFLIFVAFLLINLSVGLVYSRSVKTLKDYAVGGKDFSNAALVATIVATWSSGSMLLGGLENIYRNGLFHLIAFFGLPVGLWLTAQLATRLAEFLNNVSIAEAMGDMYGKTVQIITAISGILGKVGYIAVQFTAISKILSTLFGIDNGAATVIAASIVIAYSSLGGIKAVTFTDILQFFTFGTILPILALTIWNKIDSAQVTGILANHPTFDIKEVVGFHSKFFGMLGLMGYFSTPIGGGAPEIFQRIAMAKDAQQVKQVLTYSAGIFALILLLIAWMGILILADNSDLQPGQVVPYMISQHTHVGLKGLLGICVIALAMSTADSCLNTCSVLFANDLVKPLASVKNNPVRTARLFSITTGLAALLMSLYNQDLLKLILLSGSLYMPVYTVPFLVSVLGFRTTPRAVLLSMGAGFATVVVWSICYSNAGSIVPGMIANLTVLFGSHYLLGEPGGWTRPKPMRPIPS